MGFPLCGLFCALGAAAGLVAGPSSAAAAAQLTNRAFLSWETRDRDRWLGGAVLMAAQIEGARDAATGDCILRWYFQETAQAQRQILDGLRQNPHQSPAMTLFHLMRGECGVPLILE